MTRFYCRIFSVVVPRAAVWCHVIASYRPFSTGRFVAPFQTMWWYSWEFFLSDFQTVVCIWIILDGWKNNSLENIMWSVMGQQTAQKKKVYSGSNRIFKIFNTKWSYDKMPIDWVRWRAGRENIWLEVRTYGRANKYILFYAAVSEQKHAVKQHTPVTASSH